MLIKVAIVDDEPEIVQSLTDLLVRYQTETPRGGVDIHVYSYRTGDEFLGDNPSHFDVIFLDINLPGTNGLQTAKRVRECNRSAAIIFCTHYAQYAVKGYEVNAVGYLVKPIDECAFKRNLDRALEVLSHNQRQKLRIKTEKGIEIIVISNIVFVEVQLHTIIYHVLTKNSFNDYRVRGTMRAVSAELADGDFSQCGASYLVNLRHVTAVKNKTVFLHGGYELPVSRKYWKKFSDEFLKFMGGALIKND